MDKSDVRIRKVSTASVSFFGKPKLKTRYIVEVYTLPPLGGHRWEEKYKSRSIHKADKFATNYIAEKEAAERNNIIVDEIVKRYG